MDAGVFESAPVQSPAGSHHRPGAHHRDGNRVVSFPQNLGGAAEKESFVASVSRASTELSRGRDSDAVRSEEHTSELQSLAYLVCRLLLEKKKKNNTTSQVEI